MLLLKSISQTVLIIAVFFFFLTQQREHLGPKAHWVLLQLPLTLAFLANYGFKQSTSHCSLIPHGWKGRTSDSGILKYTFPGGGGLPGGVSPAPSFPTYSRSLSQARTPGHFYDTRSFSVSNKLKSLL